MWEGSGLENHWVFIQNLMGCCGNLEDTSESNADDRDLAYNVSEFKYVTEILLWLFDILYLELL